MNELALEDLAVIGYEVRQIMPDGPGWEEAVDLRAKTRFADSCQHLAPLLSRETYDNEIGMSPVNPERLGLDDVQDPETAFVGWFNGTLQAFIALKLHELMPDLHMRRRLLAWRMRPPSPTSSVLPPFRRKGRMRSRKCDCLGC